MRRRLFLSGFLATSAVEAVRCKIRLRRIKGYKFIQSLDGCPWWRSQMKSFLTLIWNLDLTNNYITELWQHEEEELPVNKLYQITPKLNGCLPSFRSKQKRRDSCSRPTSCRPFVSDPFRFIWRKGTKPLRAFPVMSHLRLNYADLACLPKGDKYFPSEVVYII